MKAAGQSKKFIVSFILSALIFSLSFAIFSIAFSQGREKPNVEESDLPSDLKGNSFNILLAVTDYSPDKFDDYDPQAVKNVLGSSVEASGIFSSSIFSGYRKVFAERLVIVRFDKALQKIIFIPISGNTLVSFKGVQIKLGEIASEWGTTSFIERVQALTGLKIDNYAIFSPSNAARALNLTGNIDYTIKWNLRQSAPENGIDINIVSGTSRLNGETAVDLIRFDRYDGIGTTRAEMMTGFVKRLISNLTNNFNDNQLKDLIVSTFDLSNSDFDISDDSEIFELMMSFNKLDIEYIELEGKRQTVDGVLYFLPNETEILNKLSVYREK